MRIGLFGGTFDPPHRGHIALARLARTRLSLDRVLVAPVALQPLKHETPPASFEDRVAMTRLAFAEEPHTEISLIDAPRLNGQSNYTIETVGRLQQQLGAEDRLFCIIGADSLLSIGHWHRSADLLVACNFVVGARPGFDLTHAEAALPRGIRAIAQPAAMPHVQMLELTNEASRNHARLYLLMDLAEDVSATQIRAALRGEVEPGKILNPAVEEYIRAHHLYEHL